MVYLLSPLQFRLVLFLGLLTAALRGQAQAPAWATAQALTTTSNNGTSRVTATAADASGNLYVAGWFSGTVQLGTITLTNGGFGNRNGFVAKWNAASGRFVWAQRLGGSNDGAVQALAVSGPNVYLAGSFSGATLVLGGITLPNSSSNVNSTDMFVAKLVDAGSTATYAWAQRVGGPQSERATSLAVSGSQVYVGGGFNSVTATFGPLTVSNSGFRGNVYSDDLFVTKLTDAGSSADFTWVQLAPGSAEAAEAVTDLAVSGSEVYAAGTFAGTTTFGTTGLPSAGGTDAFVARLSDAGPSSSIAWVRQLGGSVTDQASALAVSGSSVYVAGSFNSPTATFGSTTLTQSAGTGAIGFDGFVAKLTSAGAIGWAVPIGGSDIEFVYGLAAAGNGVYVTGSFSSATATFGGLSQPNASPTPGSATYDIFVARLIDAGGSAAFSWVQGAGGTSADAAYGIALGNGLLYVAGAVTQVATFGSLSVGSASFYEQGFVATLADPVLSVHPAAGALAGVAVFPNPAHRTATVRLPAGSAATLRLLDALGQIVCVHTAPAGQDYAFDLTGLAPGIYTLRLQAGEAQVTQKLLVE